MGTRTRTRKLLAAVGLSVCGLLAMPANANAAGSVSELGVGQGTLLAKGAAIRVPTTYTCEGVWVYFSLRVQQRVSGGALAAGTAYGGEQSAVPLVCDGTTRQVTLIVYADTTLGTAFKSGTAFATAGISACDETFVCWSLSQETEIRLANK